jgi:transposase InsO family protein
VHIRSDNGPEFIAAAIRSWLASANVKTLYIEPGAPWENGYAESFHGRLRDELLDAELFTCLAEAKMLRAVATGVQPPAAAFEPGLRDPGGVGRGYAPLVSARRPRPMPN